MDDAMTMGPGHTGPQPERHDTSIGLLAHFQGLHGNSWQTHSDQHKLEDKALELALARVADTQDALDKALALAVHHVDENHQTLRTILENKVGALAAIVEQKGHDADERAIARRDAFEKDLFMWRTDHMRMHDIVNKGTDAKHEAMAKQAETYDSESRARWDNHHQTHASQELRAQESVGALTRLQEEKQHAHDQIHNASQRAIDIADKGMTEKLGEMNNLRQQITAERGTYVNRDMLDTRISQVLDQIASLGKRVDDQTTALGKANDTRLSSLERAQNIAIGVLGLGMFLIPLALRFLPGGVG